MKNKTSRILFFFACCLVMFALPMAYAGDDQKCGKCECGLDRKMRCRSP